MPEFRRMPVADMLVWLAEHGEPADPRTDIDTDSLVRRFPHQVGVETLDAEADGPDGPVPVRAYRDPAVPATDVGLVWVHGGAFIGGHLDMPEANWVARELASRGIPVLSVDYRKCLAGVHYPAPSDDVLAAWAFARADAERLLGVSGQRLVLGGASAGAALAASAVVRLRDAGDLLPAGLVQVYPAVHPNAPAASAEVDPSSPHGQLALNYAGSDAVLRDRHAFAGLDDGHGFPPTLVVVCERDELRPSGAAFAANLQAAGTPVELHLEPDAEHGHIDHPGDPGALRTIDAMVDWIAHR